MGEVVVVAESQISMQSEPVPPSEPPPSETGADGVHKDVQGSVPYYTQGHSGMISNPQMMVMSPYHSMVRPTARYADDANGSAWQLTSACGGGRAQQSGALVPGMLHQPSSAHFVEPGTRCIMGPGARAVLRLAPPLVRWVEGLGGYSKLGSLVRPG